MMLLNKKPPFPYFLNYLYTRKFPTIGNFLDWVSNQFTKLPTAYVRNVVQSLYYSLLNTSYGYDI